jgi:hypothetical protein
MVCTMPNSVEQGTLAAVVKTATYKSVVATTKTISGASGTTSVGVNSTSGISNGMGISGTGIPVGATVSSIVGTNGVTISANTTAIPSGNGAFTNFSHISYTTEDPHNFQAGQSVTVTGITGGTSANVSGLTIVNTPTAKSFIAAAANGNTFATGTAPVVGTGSSAVTAWATNSWANLYEIKYANPEPLNVAPFYLEITSNINAEAISPYPTDGTVSVKLNWSAIGGSNPLAAFKITKTVGATTTNVIATASAVGSTTVTGLTADTVYTFGVTASNIFKTVTATTGITVPKFISNMASITASATASTANNITISWARPVTSSPLPISYELQRSSSTDNATWSTWTTLSNSISGASTSYIDSTVADLIYYRYQIRAYNGLYSSFLISNSLRAYYITTPMVTPVVSYGSATTKQLSITASGFISNPTITSWKVERSTTGTNGWSTVATAATSLPYVDPTVDLSTTYYYRLTGTNGQLTSATSAASVGRLTYSVPNAPTNFAATPSTTQPYQVDITWTAATIPSPGIPAVSNYILERSINNVTWSVVTNAISSSATSYFDTDRDLNTAYYYRLTAVNGVGSSATSTVDSATITLIAGTATATVATTTVFNTAATISASTNASRSVTLQVSTNNSTWSDVETKTANSSGNTSFTYNITRSTNSFTYFRLQVAQSAIYLPTTSSSVSTKTTNNSLSRSATYAGWYAPNGSQLTQVRVLDGQSRAVAGATVYWYYKQFEGGWTNTGYSNTTDSNGYANYFWNSPESRAIAAYVTKTNYDDGGAAQESIHTEYIQQSIAATQDNYGSYAENNGWGARIGGDNGYMYSGWWSTNQGRQAGAAYFSSMPWSRINKAVAIDDVKIDITRIGGTGGTGMNVSYGVHNSATKISNFNSLGKATNLLWGATNRPAYTSSGNNRDYGTSLAGLKDYFRDAAWSTGAKGLTFGHTTESATQDNYFVANNNVTLYIWYKADPLWGDT